MRQQCLCERNGREQVDIDNPLIDRQIGIDCGRPLGDAGIVHQHVDMALKRDSFGYFASQPRIIDRIKWQNETTSCRTGFDRNTL